MAKAAGRDDWLQQTEKVRPVIPGGECVLVLVDSSLRAPMRLPRSKRIRH